MVIYLITNKINGKQYVGQTIHTAELRFAQHCKPSETNCRLLNRAIQKYGRENFEVSVLEDVDSQDLLDEKEIYWIDKLNTLSPLGYNLNGGGNGKGGVSEETRKKLSEALKGKFAGENNPFYGKTHTAETREKLRKPHPNYSGEKNHNYGKPLPDEVKAKLSAKLSGENHYCYGKHLSLETRAKISEANKGKKLSEEAIRRMAESKRGKKASPETRKKLSEMRKGKLVGDKNPMAKKVKCLETGEIFNTLTEAAQSIGVWPESLSRRIKSETHSCKGFHWEFIYSEVETECQH